MANEKLTETPKYLYKLKNVDKLLAKLCPGKKYEYQVDAAMIPQYSLSFNSITEAQECFATISETKKYIKNIWLEINSNDNVLTISTNLNANEDQFFIKGQSYSYDQLGYQQLSIEAHHTARHCPEGTLIIYNSKTSNAYQNTVDYLEYAPAMLKFFGLETSEYMPEPQFTI